MAEAIIEPAAAPVDMARLRRIRWAVRAVLLLGVAASVVGNVRRRDRRRRQ